MRFPRAHLRGVNHHPCDEKGWTDTFIILFVAASLVNLGHLKFFLASVGGKVTVRMVNALSYLIDVLRGHPSSLFGSVYPDAVDVSDAQSSAAAKVLEACAPVPELLHTAHNDTGRGVSLVHRARDGVSACLSALETLHADSPDLKRLLQSSANTDFLLPNMSTAEVAMCSGLQSHANLRSEEAYADLTRLRQRLHKKAKALVKNIVRDSCDAVEVMDRNKQPVRFYSTEKLTAPLTTDDDDVPTGIWILLVVILCLFLLVVALLIAMQVQQSRRNAVAAD